MKKHVRHACTLIILVFVLATVKIVFLSLSIHQSVNQDDLEELEDEIESQYVNAARQTVLNRRMTQKTEPREEWVAIFGQMTHYDWKR